MRVEINPNAPHQTVISVTIYAETCERLPSGQISTKVAEKQRESMAFTCIGNTLGECVNNKNALINQIRERIRNGKE